MRRFTLLELLVVMAVILILAGLTVGVVLQASARGRQTKCSSNLRQLGIAIHLYTDSHDGRLPVAARLGPDSLTGWPSLPGALADVADPQLFACPDDGPPEAYFPEFGTSYEWNTFVNGRMFERTRFTIIGLSVETPLLGDAAEFHGENRRLVLWPDGRVETSLELIFNE